MHFRTHHVGNPGCKLLVDISCEKDSLRVEDNVVAHMRLKKIETGSSGDTLSYRGVF